MNSLTRSIVLCSIIACSTLVLTSCRSTYYKTWEKLGYHKRDILVERVEDARNDQAEAKEQFRDALEAFNSVVTVPPSELQSTYKKLNKEFERSEARAEDVEKRIAKVDQVANDLFAEWEEELDAYTNESLRRKSEDQLRETRNEYGGLYRAMTRAEAKMQPVLGAFRDQVLFLKHNLNAQAIASLQGEVNDLEVEITDLIREMEAAIAEADSFIANMSKS